jgi:response regulator RpfG family c-di-GMP phosphodiesterase
MLCVDDEQAVLDGLTDSLRRSFQVRTATTAAAGLALLRTEPDAYAIVISDMRMPVMSGAVFLREARLVAPSAVRMLLTGQTSIDAAIAAVNDGQLFRFLTKPCGRDDLLKACAAALHQHHLLSSEKVLLEQTLHGSLQAITDVLALTHPAAFARCTRVKKTAARVARTLQLEDAWAVEIAAMLSDIGALAIDEATLEKSRRGERLEPEAREQIKRMPFVAQRILANIPRLDGLRAIVSMQHSTLGEAPDQPLGARILKVAHDFDVLTDRGADAAVALATLLGRKGAYDARVLEALGSVLGEASGAEVREVAVRQLAVGMRLVEHARSPNGSLLVPRDYVVNEELLERLSQLKDGAVCEPLRVVTAKETPT